MHALEEDLVGLIWVKLAEQSPEEILQAMQLFRDEQAPLFQSLTDRLQDCSETALEVLLYLAVTVYQVLAWRRLPHGPLKLPPVDADRVARAAKKRAATVAPFLSGKQALALDIGDALESLVDRFDLPQLALLGHATEGLLAAHEEGDLSREEVELCFVRLLVMLDVLDQVVKS